MGSNDVVKDQDSNYQGSNTIIEQMISSCSGAILTSLFVTPFDVVKTRLQVKGIKSCNLSDYCSKEFSVGKNNGFHCCKFYKRDYKGTIDTTIKLYKYEGISSFWSGLPPTLLMAIPSNVIYFTLYEQINGKLSESSILSIDSRFIPVLAGVTARVLTGTVVSPVEFVRTKIQSEDIKYSDAFKSLGELINAKGITAVWRGWVPTMLRDVPFSAIYWGLYEQLKRMNPEHSVFSTFLFGAFSGSVSAIITLPLDVIKTQRQAELGDKNILIDTERKATYSLLIRLYKRGGIKALFAGVVPRILKVGPSCAIMISSYEVGKLYFRNNRMKYEDWKDD